MEGQCVLNANGKNNPQPDEEYILNNTYLGKYVYRQLLLIRKGAMRIILMVKYF